MIEQICITTKDGTCPAQMLTPSGEGPWPAVIFYMDAGGIRPAMVEMAQRLAQAGFAVLLPDLYYRHGPYGPLVPKDVFAGDVGAILGPLMSTTGNHKAAEDTQGLLTYLSTRADLAATKVGAIGFCMGGGMALSAAALYPDRFTAVASVHGGNLATDASTSPHGLVSRLTSAVYIAAATNDDSYPAAMAERLEGELRKAGVRFQTETYPGAHGWMVPDFPVHDAAVAENAWEKLFSFFHLHLSTH